MVYTKHYNPDFAVALETAQKARRVLFMPEIADAKINDDSLWREWYSSVSLRATGRTKQGTPVVVYAHVPNFYSNPENIRQAKAQGLINGAGVLPEDEFQRLLSLEGQGVFVVDYKALKNSQSDVIPVERALNHPQVIPFLGGQKRAEIYLAKHKEVVGNKIGVWHNDDLQEQPVARPLLFGGCYDLLYADGGFGSVGHFLGVQLNDAEGIAKKVPTLEDIIAVTYSLVPEVLHGKLREDLGRLYSEGQ